MAGKTRLSSVADRLASSVAAGNPGALHAAVIDNGVSGGKGGARVAVGPRNVFDGIAAARQNAKAQGRKYTA